MKRIEAIIPEENAGLVFAGLKELELGGFTYHSVKGRGARKREIVRSGSGRHESQFNLNTHFFVIVKDHMAEKVIDVITSLVSTGLKGEGKIFVTSVGDTVDVGTKIRGEPSL